MRPVISLTDITRTLLSEALDLYGDNPWATTWIHHHLNRLDEPLRIAVTGTAQSGKSTLVNVLAGEQVSPVEVESGGQPFTRYRDAPTPRATVYPYDGSGYDLPVTRSGGRLYIDPADSALDDVDEVVVELPIRSLRHAHLIDTPALTPLDVDGVGRTVASRVLHDADVVLYLTRHLSDADLWFLQAAQASGAGVSMPINMLSVLSRADETAGARIDALISAKQLARRRRRDPTVRELCQSVIALAPLIAYAGITLRESEFVALAVLADAPRDDLNGLLLSTDRFVRAEFPPVRPDVRQALLDRFGILGARLATTLIRAGCQTREQLSGQLVRRSGLTELRETISELFLRRRRPFKVRSALLALRSLLQAEPRPEAEYLVAELERAVAGAHAFQELWLLASLHTGRLTLPDTLAAQARQLVGGDGTSIPARLGLQDEASEVDVWTNVEETLRRWQKERDDPLLTAGQRRAVDVVIRTCEGMLPWAQ